MTNFPSRSNSFPSQSHPVTESVEDHLYRLKSSEAASTSASAICANLASLADFLRRINDQMKKSSIQQVLSREEGQKLINELLEGSLKLVDLCGFSRDIVLLAKAGVQDLESSFRRNKADTSAVDIESYIASRNKIKKMINKYAKGLKSFNQNVKESTGDLKAIGTMLIEAEALSSSTLKSVLTLLSGERERSSQKSWSLFSKFLKTNRVHYEVDQDGSDEDLCLLDIPKLQKGVDRIVFQNTWLKQLKLSEMKIQELEEGLEALLRSLIKTRVSLLNVVSQ